MNKFIPENIYKEFLKNMPIFCIDFLINYKDEFLLLKRNEEPLKGIYWLPGGRLKKNETLDKFSHRVQSREIRIYFKNYSIIGFSNFLFKESINSRATHTPTLLFEITVQNKFTPNIDKTHSEYRWSKDLPSLLIKNLILFNSSKSNYIFDK